MDGRLRHRQRGTRDRLRLIRRPRFRLLLSGRTPRGVWWRVCNTLSMGGNPGRRRPRRLRSFLPRGPRGAILRQGTPVHLVFATDVNSKTADVEEQINLTWPKEIKPQIWCWSPKASSLWQPLPKLIKPGPGAPGNIVFQVDSMDANGNLVKLWGSETLEGRPKPPNAALLVPYVGLFTLFRHGKDAEIKPGTPVTAYVDADTSLSTADLGSSPIS